MSFPVPGEQAPGEEDFLEGTAIPNEQPDALPLIGSWVSRAEELCPRRLHEDYSGAPRTKEPFNQGRVRETVIDAIRVFHETGTMPSAPAAHLWPEEQRVVAHALGWYPKLFPDESPTDVTVELPLEPTTDLPRRGIRISGMADLAVTATSPSRRELRQLAFGAGAPESPLDLPATRLAVLRLAQERWVSPNGEPEQLSVVWVDLLHGLRRDTVIDIPGDLPALGGWLDERVAVVHERMDATAPQPGRDCTMCRYVPRCPLHPVRGAMFGKKQDILPGIVTLSPTGLDTWARCRREWRNHVVLRLPASDPVGGTDHGLYLHDILRFVHENAARDGFTCRDEARVAEILDSHGADARVVDEVRRHAAKCPGSSPGATSVGHELEWVRTNPVPPVFLASARLDAVWLLDPQDQQPVLEIRDYKTGQRFYDSISEDPRAQLQAWVAAPVAEARGARLRIRYEHLAREIDEDPAPWEPDLDDLARIDEQLRDVVTEMRAERDWQGVNDATFCRYCRYRSICPDSATPSEPAWSSLQPEG